MRKIDPMSSGISFGTPRPKHKEDVEDKYHALRNDITEMAKEYEFDKNEMKEIFQGCGIRKNMEKEEAVERLGCVKQSMRDMVED